MTPPTTDNFCSRCGVSLQPLPVPHSSAACETCGKLKHFVRLDERGKGPVLVAGETFTIPGDWFKVSFDPIKSNGQLSRHGVPFLLRELFLNGMPNGVAQFTEAMQRSRESWEQDLRHSDKLAGIDLSSPEGGDQAVKRLESDKESWEWNLLVKDIFAGMAVDEAASGNAVNAAYAGLYAGLHHGMSIVTEPYFEEMVWRGYQAGLVIHECGEAANAVPGEAEALAELDPLFVRLGEATLRTWVESGLPLAPRLRITSLPEPIVVARAKWHLAEFQRQREAADRHPAEQRARWDFRMRVVDWLIGGAAVAGLSQIWSWLGGPQRLG